MQIIIVRLFCFLFLSICIAPVIKAQEVIILRSTQGVSGISKSVNSGGKQFYIKQSIGQPGVTGTGSRNDKTLIQGFIQPALPKAKVSKTGELQGNIEILSSSGLAKVVFKDEKYRDASVSIFNMLGQLIYSQNIYQSNEFMINMNSFDVGCYILFIKTSREQYTTKLLKTN